MPYQSTTMYFSLHVVVLSFLPALSVAPSKTADPVTSTSSEQTKTTGAPTAAASPNEREGKASAFSEFFVSPVTSGQPDMGKTANAKVNQDARAKSMAEFVWNNLKQDTAGAKGLWIMPRIVAKLSSGKDLLLEDIHMRVANQPFERVHRVYEHTDEEEKDPTLRSHWKIHMLSPSVTFTAKVKGAIEEFWTEKFQILFECAELSIPGKDKQAPKTEHKAQVNLILGDVGIDVLSNSKLLQGKISVTETVAVTAKLALKLKEYLRDHSSSVCGPVTVSGLK